MSYRVQVRINKLTGEIEVFQVVDQGVGRRAGHDAEHDEIAQALGALVERRAEIEEEVPGAGVPVEPLVARPLPPEEGEETPERERRTR